jgi:hypothetical protein
MACDFAECGTKTTILTQQLRRLLGRRHIVLYYENFYEETYLLKIKKLVS